MHGDRLASGKFLQRANMLASFRCVMKNQVRGKGDADMRNEFVSLRAGQHIAGSDICDRVHKLFLFHQVTQQKGKGNNYACANQNTFEGFADDVVFRAFTELLKKGVLVCRRDSLIPLPFADGDRMDAGKLGEFSLVEAKLSAQFSDFRCVQALIF